MELDSARSVEEHEGDKGMIEVLNARQELERYRRVEGNQAIAKANAYKVAQMILNAAGTTLAKGSSYTKYLEERERKRRIQVANADSSVTGSSADSRAHTRSLEEEERNRRINCISEPIAMRMSVQVAEVIQAEVAAARAKLERLNKEHEQHLLQYHQTGEIPSSLEFSLDESPSSPKNIVYHGTRFLMDFLVWGLVITRDIVTALIPIAQAATTYAPCFAVVLFTYAVCGMNIARKEVRSLAYGAMNLARKKVRSLVYGVAVEDIVGMEEKERQRRIREDSENGVARATGRRAASLIKQIQYPFNKFGIKAGFLRYTACLEEKERLCRLSDKEGAQICQSNAHQIAALFMEYARPSQRQSKLEKMHSIEEKERLERVSNQASINLAQWNARAISALIRQVFASFSGDAFARAYTRNLEEAERRYRMRNYSNAMFNARAVADLFAASKYYSAGRTHVSASELFDRCMSHCEGVEDMYSSDVKRMAREFAISESVDREEVEKSVCELEKAALLAEKITDLISNDIVLSQEIEREFRVADKMWQQQAMSNARKICNMLRARTPHTSTPTPSRHLSRSRSNSAESLRASLGRSRHALLDIPSHLPAPAGDIDDVVTHQYAVAIAPPNTPRDEADIEANKSAISATAEEERPTPTPQNAIPVVYPLNKQLATSLSPESERKLVEGVRKLYDNESKSAAEETSKAQKSQEKHGLFGNYRKQRHEHAAAKHKVAADRHEQYLKEKDMTASLPYN